MIDSILLSGKHSLSLGSSQGRNQEVCSGCDVGSGVGGASREHRANPRSVGDVGGAVAHR